MKSKKIVLFVFIIALIAFLLFSCNKSPSQQTTTSNVITTTESTVTESEASKEHSNYTFDKKSNTLTISGTNTHTLSRDAYMKIISDLHEKNLVAETIILTEGFEKIETDVISNDDDLKSVVLPASLSVIEHHVFSDCDKLTNITVNPQSQHFVTDKVGVLFSKDMTTLVTYPSALPNEEYTIPETVTNIYSNAFYRCPNLRILTLAPNLTGTFTHWFYCCDNLEKVTAPIKSLNFYSDEQGVIYTKDTKEIVFVPANLRTLVLSENVNSFSTHSMINNELITEIILDNTTLNIEDYVYQFANLKKFTINGNHPDYSSFDGVLYSKDGSKLIWYPPMKDNKTFTVPDTVEHIDFLCGKNLEKITISDSVKEIDNSAFQGCESLEYIHIGKGLEKFDYNDEFSVEHENVFDLCRNLKKITVASSNKNFITDKYGALCTADMKNIITLPANGSTEKYVINDSVARILDCFKNCKNLKKLHVGSGVEWINIGEADTETIVGFEGCTSLEEITVSSGNENYISVDGVLYSKDKTELYLYPANKPDEEFLIPDSIEFVGDFAFNDNRNLKRIYAGAYTNSNLVFNFTDFQKNFQLPIDIYYSCKKEDFPHDYLRDNPNIHFESNELPGK